MKIIGGKIMVKIKSPRAKDREDYEKEGKISSLWYEKGIDSLMKKSTEILNKIIRWSDSGEKDKIKKEIAGMSKKEIRERIEGDIEEYKKAIEAVNQKVEKVYGKMEGVEITTTEMSVMCNQELQEIIDSLFPKNR